MIKKIIFYLYLWIYFSPHIFCFQGSVENPCRSSEKWNNFFPLSADLKHEFSKALGFKISPLRSFSDAFFLRKQSFAADQKVFAEYWISRSLFQGKIYESASQGFNSILKYETDDSLLPLQMASIECLNLMRLNTYPAAFSTNTMNKIPLILIKNKDKKITPQYSELLKSIGTEYFLSLMEKEAPVEKMEEILKLLSPFFRSQDPFQYYTQGLLSAFKKDYSLAIKNLKQLLTLGKRPLEIEKKKEHIYLLLGYLLYSVYSYSDAVKYFKKIEKTSNLLPNALTGIAWSHVSANESQKAIGIGISAQSSWMKRTFIPEPLLIASMTLNELCHYPEAIRFIDLLQYQYSSSFDWLKKFFITTNKNSSLKLYPVIIQFLKGKNTNSSIPLRLMTELIKDPLFLKIQEQINALLEQDKKIAHLSRQGEAEQSQIIEVVLKEIKELKEEMKKLREQKARTLNKKAKQKMDDVITHLNTYRRFHQGAFLWNSMKKTTQQRTENLQTIWLSLVEDHGKVIYQNLYKQLSQIAENRDLIEIEILNGAGDDLIIQNSENNKHMRKQKIQERKQKTSEIYEWGSSVVSLDGSGEVWEDELDSVETNLDNKCTHQQ